MRVLSSACILALVASSGQVLAQASHQVRQAPPVKMGTSGGSASDASNLYCCGGTLGAAVMRDGVLCILSNNHVLARSGSATNGEDTIQPGLIDSNCGSSTNNRVGDFAGNLVPLGTANVDTALSVARAGMVDSTGNILDVGVPCANPQTPALNLQVLKSGRTTGLTTGRITSLNTSVTIRYQKGCNSGRQFNISYQNQIVTTAMSSGGDSGSLLLSNDGTPNPVGLLYAGSSSSTVYNPIQDVINAYTAGGHSFSFVGTNCSPLMEPPVAGPNAQDYAKALQVKVEHEAELLAKKGVFGVGVGTSDQDTSVAVIVIFAEPGAVLPPKIDDVPTKVILTDPFVAQ